MINPPPSVAAVFPLTDDESFSAGVLAASIPPAKDPATLPVTEDMRRNARAAADEPLGPLQALESRSMRGYDLGDGRTAQLVWRIGARAR